MSKTKVICLHKNEANFPLPESIVKPKAGKKLVRYYPEEYNRTLYQKLASFHQISPANLFLANGLEETLLHFLKSIHLFNRDLKVYFPQFTWDYYQSLLTQAQFSQSVITSPSSPSPFDLQAATTYLTAHSSPTLVILVSPNNPDGQEIPPTELESLVTAFPHHIFLIDQAYIGFGNSDYRCPDLTKLAINSKNLVLARSFSKYLSAPGIRLGYLITTSSLLNDLHLTPSYLGINHYTQNISLKIIDNFPSISSQNQLVKHIRQEFINKLNSTSLFECQPTATNFVLVKVLSPFDPSNLSKFLFAKGFQIKTFSPNSVLNQHLRISLAPTIHLNKLFKLLVRYFQD